MNYKMVFRTLGYVLMIEAMLLLLPSVVSVIYNESCVWSLLASVGITFGIGSILVLVFKKANPVIYAKEGFIIVSLSWIAMSLFGALPFVISEEIPNFIDAFFEIVSGFTTTGATILTDVEKMSKGLLFWRSFSHWIGGMGVLVFVLAIMPKFSDRTMHIMRAEMPGHSVGKLVPRAKETARILYLIYIVMTIAEALLLFAGEMNLFESMIHALGTAGTGGFGIKNDSLASYSPYSQCVITVFMLLFGINFNLYYFLLIKKARSVLKSEELWTYLGIFLFATAMIAGNTHSQFDTLGETIRHSAFQVSSIMTTTGYSTTNFASWPMFSRGIILFLMIVGGCGGSTAGGLKVSRFVLLIKTISREFRKMLHPNTVRAIRFEGKTVEEETVTNVSVYFSLYIICMIVIFLLLSLEPFSIETNLSATFSTFNNIGPGLGSASSSFVAYSPFSKLVMSFSMLLGRLEIFPLLITFSPSFRKK